MNLKDMIKDNKKVHFKFYRSHILFYETDDGFLFEVPVSEVGTGTMERDDRAILFMRWIRKQIESNEEGLKESQNG